MLGISAAAVKAGMPEPQEAVAVMAGGVYVVTIPADMPSVYVADYIEWIKDQASDLGIKLIFLPDGFHVSTQKVNKI